MFWRDPRVAEHASSGMDWSLPLDMIPLLPINVFDASESEEMNEDPKFFYNEETRAFSINFVFGQVILYTEI